LYIATSVSSTQSKLKFQPFNSDDKGSGNNNLFLLQYSYTQTTKKLGVFVEDIARNILVEPGWIKQVCDASCSGQPTCKPLKI